LEKIGAIVDIHDRSRPNAPTRKWSTNWKQSSLEEDMEPPTSPRLVINASQTFEVRHEDRSQAALRPPQDSYVRLDDSAHNLRNQWQSDKVFGHRPKVSSLTSNKLRAAERASPLSSSPPVLSLGDSHESDSKMASRTGKHGDRTATTVSPIQESFYISAPSAGESDASLRSGKSGQHSPLDPGSADSSQLGIQAEEKRWEIERNPFKDDQRSHGVQEEQRGSTSPGLIQAHTRWGSVPDAYETRTRKRSLSIDRLVTQQTEARML
jgi:hypothetical protein